MAIDFAMTWVVLLETPVTFHFLFLCCGWRWDHSSCWCVSTDQPWGLRHAWSDRRRLLPFWVQTETRETERMNGTQQAEMQVRLFYILISMSARSALACFCISGNVVTSSPDESCKWSLNLLFFVIARRFNCADDTTGGEQLHRWKLLFRWAAGLHTQLALGHFELIWTLNGSFRSVPGPVRLQLRPNGSPDLPPGGGSDGTLWSPEVKKNPHLTENSCSYFSDVTREMLDFFPL